MAEEMAPARPDETASEAWVGNDTDFASRLALVRHRMRWNVKEAARECGFPAATWRLWEEGATPRNLITVCMTISTRTRADIDWLIYGPAREEVAALRAPTKKYGSSNIPGMIDYASGTGSTRVLGRIDVPRPRDNRPVGRPTPTRPVTSTRPTVQAQRPVSRMAMA